MAPKSGGLKIVPSHAHFFVRNFVHKFFPKCCLDFLPLDLLFLLMGSKGVETNYVILILKGILLSRKS